MDEEEELVPEDDSVFDGLLNESIEISSDALVDDSFSSMLGSTPLKATKKGKARPPPSPLAVPAGRSSPRRPQRSGSPMPAQELLLQVEALSPRSTSARHEQQSTSPAAPSPSRSSARLAQRCSSPNPAQVLPSQSEASSPRRTSARIAQRSSSPCPAQVLPSQSEASSPRRTSARLAQRSSSPSPAQVLSSQSEASSPRRSARQAQRSSSPAPTAAPNTMATSSSSAPRPPPTQSRIKCRECPNTFANDRTFAVHKKMHSLKRAFSKMASEEDFKEHLPKLFHAALKRMLRDPTIGNTAIMLDNFVNSLIESFKEADDLHDEYFKFLFDNIFPIFGDVNSLFSSSLSFLFYTRINCLLNDSQFSTDFKNHIRSIDVNVKTPDDILNLFLGSSMLHLTTEIIVFSLQRIHGATATDTIRQKRSDDSVDSETFLQLCYHIGGSVVSGFLFKGGKYKANHEHWSVFVDILKSKFSRDTAIGNQCAENVSAFTTAKDRGGLKHISQEALDFFVVLFDELMSHEGEDGSLPQNVIDDKVLGNGAIICLWDVLVGNDLEDEVSLDFLMRMAETCKLIVMKGIMKRRLNDHHKKHYASLALRSRLAK